METKQLSIECAFADFAYVYCETADKNLQLAIIGDNFFQPNNGEWPEEITAEQLEKLYNLPVVKITPDFGSDPRIPEIEIDADGQLYRGVCLDVKEVLNGIINYIYSR